MTSVIEIISLLQGVARDYERAAEAYMHAQSQSNAQAMFNLGYMHEHGHGLPLDLHLAKRYYDQAVTVDSAAKLPVMLALTSLWLRKNYADSFLVRHYILYVLCVIKFQVSYTIFTLSPSYFNLYSSLNLSWHTLFCAL